jgi:FlaA1/EpsC-like NDP-sugar epimerase
VAVDSILSVAAVWVAYQLRFDFAVPLKHQAVMWTWAALFAVLCPACLWISGAYNGIWRHFNLNDALLLAVGALPPTALVLVVRIGLAGRIIAKAGLPLTVIVIDYGVFLTLALSVRGVRRMLFEASLRGKRRKRTLLIGSEEGLASGLRQLPMNAEVFVVGLLSPDENLHGSNISGFRVIGDTAALSRQLLRGEVDLVLIADADVDSIARIVETGMHFGVEVRLLPSATHILKGDVRVSTIPKPEHAMDRACTFADKPHPAVIEAFSGRTVLITGAGGSIGSELSRQVSYFPVARILLLDQDENSIFYVHSELNASGRASCVPLVADIRDRDHMHSIFARYNPDIVLHAAAYKHVPVMEDNCCEAVLNNVLGTRTVAELAVEFSAERFLMISTDKAVNPSSIMGATKRMAELLVQDIANRHRGQASATRCTCVRFGNVMSSNGSVAPIFLKQIASGGPVTITHAEMTRYFMTIPEAVQLVLQAATIGSNGEIYILDMGDPVKITTLARRLIEMSGLRPGADIEVQFVGMRPGEKLHEELWSDSSEVNPTSLSRVLHIQPPPPSADFATHLAFLEAAAFSHDDERARQAILTMPISYTAVTQAKSGARSSTPVSVKPIFTPELAHRGLDQSVGAASA